jgi:undecaprenyl-diphosphatase
VKATLLCVALVGSFVFGLLAIPAGRGEKIASDSEAMRLAADVRARPVTAALSVLTDVGASPVVGVVVLATLAFLGRRRRITELIVLGAGSALTVSTVTVVKAAVDRPRPKGGLVDTAGASFPSGHAAYAVAYVAVAAVLGRSVAREAGRRALIAGAVALALFVGLTRVYLRAHYWSDVLAGWGLAAALFSVCGLGALAVGAFRHNAGAG